uniref:Rho GTPase activating protein 4 n=1 Tax=Ailuropoda melanoleuca TaxID=9646 RepID=A0A7N5KPX2_AILME
MAAHGKLRRERGLQAEYEAQVKEMRWQLSEQLRCLELQGELRRELLQELAEFMRRRAEVELEYSRGLDKLAERFSSRGGRLGGSSREYQSFRKEPSLLSPLHCWAVLLQQTRQQSRESATLSEVLAGPLAQRLSHIAEDVGRIVKKSKDLGQRLQEELLEVVAELQTVAEIRVEMELRDEILPRAQNIQSRLDRQTIETEEVSKTLKATLQALLEVVASEEVDVLDSLQASPSTESLKSASSDPGARQAGRRRGQQQDTETFYVMKLQEYLSGRSILAKLQAKHEKLQEAIQRGDKEEREVSWTQYTQRKQQKSRHPRPSSQYNQKLFGGDMEKFIQSSGQPVPLVVESCVRFINLHGLQHEGIFRVSGAQPRVSEIRDAFERGEDPLVEGCTAHDLDSVAGVLKLYFRSLDPPLFPPDLFRELLASAELEAMAERVEHVGRLLGQLPAAVLVVLRYLFTFLNHLAQYSDENMMDPYNLAVCFGPTLLPVPAGQDPVALQGRVNQLVQTLIVQPSRVFPPLTLLPGPIYEKCMAPPSSSCLGDAQLEGLVGENEPELEAGTPAQEDDLEGVVEAVACFAYTGRTAQELSFQRGDVLRLHERASGDWWRGECAGAWGLIPHKYITLPGGAEKHTVGQGPQAAGELVSSPEVLLAMEFVHRPEPCTPPEASLGIPGGPSGHRRHCLVPTSPERYVEVDKAVAQTMDSVFKELLGKTSARQGLGPVSTSSPGPGLCGLKPPACGRLGRNKGFSRGSGVLASPSASHPQSLDSPLKH